MMMNAQKARENVKRFKEIQQLSVKETIMKKVNEALELIEEASKRGELCVVFATRSLNMEKINYLMEELENLGFKVRCQNLNQIRISW